MIEIIITLNHRLIILAEIVIGELIDYGNFGSLMYQKKRQA
jgi:hypothetical protein